MSNIEATQFTSSQFDAHKLFVAMTQCAKLRVALVGHHHCHQFIKALRAEDTFDVQHHHRIPHDTSIAVLVLSGDGPTLSESDIDRLLQSKTVIALFKPSRSLLVTIHKATNTPIDIPNLELVDDLPLLIYSANGTVHVAPNNVPSEDKVQAFVESALDNRRHGREPPMKSFTVSIDNANNYAEQSVFAISSALEAVQSVRSLVSNLDPPIGIIGFKKGTLSNTAKISIKWLAWARDGTYGEYTEDPALIQKYDMNWYTDLYSYATGADPRDKSSSDFTKEGGVVYTVAIDRGNLRRASDSAPRFLGPTSGYCGYYFVDWNQTGTHSGSSMDMIGYQPKGLTSQSGTTSTYAIDFQQDMQMLSNGGNTIHTFRAQYTNQFTLDRFQQHAVQGSSGVDYSLNYKDYYDKWADPNFTTETWWNPGVYEYVNREGWKHWIVREYLPADNIPINALTVFSSSVGKHELYSKYGTDYRAFKSNAWRTTSDPDWDKARFRRTAIYYPRSWTRTLDLTWSFGSKEGKFASRL